MTNRDQRIEGFKNQIRKFLKFAIDAFYIYDREHSDHINLPDKVIHDYRGYHIEVIFRKDEDE